MESLDIVTLGAQLRPGVVMWTFCFVLARFVLFRGRSADFANRVVSILHALLALLLSVKALDWSRPLATVGQPNTAAQAWHGRLSSVPFSGFDPS